MKMENELRVLLTGGAGFIGSHFFNLLVNRRYVEKITLIDKMTYAANLKNIENNLNDSRVEFIQGDICDSVLINKISKQHNVIINFAAESHVDRSIIDANSFVYANILGVQNLLDCALQNQIEKFIQISTDEVYGSKERGNFHENDGFNPNSPYAASKASAELLARSYHKTYGLDVRVTRSCNNYGSFQYPEKVIPVFINSLLSGKKIPLYGNGKNIREWVHVEDNCLGIESVLLKGKSGNTYNIGSGIELSNFDLANKILKILDYPPNAIEFVPDRKGHDFRYAVDSTKIKHELNFSIKNNFEEKLIETINWYKNNQSWWH
jgi:dTDP-glucose 4,6-dehydratase